MLTVIMTACAVASWLASQNSGAAIRDQLLGGKCTN